MKLSFEDIGAVVATCLADDEVQGGGVVAMSGSAAVGPCADGGKFCGVAMQPRCGIAGVQFKGFMQVKHTGELNVGYAKLVGDGQGGVRQAASGEEGVEVLVVCADEAGLAVICL